MNLISKCCNDALHYLASGRSTNPSSAKDILLVILFLFLFKNSQMDEIRHFDYTHIHAHVMSMQRTN